MIEQSQRIEDANISVSGTDVREQPQKILSSADFHATEQQSAFLSYIVLESLAGRNQEINGYVVATKVFGRATDFNPSHDPIVSMQANKLRRALERYYLTSGVEDAVKIEVPKGRYVPTFTRQQQTTRQDTLAQPDQAPHSEEAWPAIEICHFKNFTGNPEKDFLSQVIATKLAVNIGYSQEVKIDLKWDSSVRMSADMARFALYGHFYDTDDGIAITVHLQDRKKKELVFAETYLTKVSAEGFLASSKEGIGVIAIKIIGEHGEIVKILAEESKDKSKEALSAYEVVLRYY